MKSATRGSRAWGNFSLPAGLPGRAGTAALILALVLGACAPSGEDLVTLCPFGFVTLSPETATIGLGETQQFSASGSCEGGAPTDVSALAAWSSDNTGVASIGATGLAQGVANGTANITATWEGVSAIASLQVGTGGGTPTVTAVSVTPATPATWVNGTLQFKAEAEQSDNTTLDITSRVTWSSSDTAKATISTAGLVTGVSTGTASITAADPESGLSGSALLRVATGLASISLSPANSSIGVGTKNTIIATGTFKDGSSSQLSAAANQVDLISSDTNIATVVVADVTGKAAGTVTIRASAFDGFENISGSAQLTVSPVAATTVTPSAQSLSAGSPVQYQALATLGNGVAQDITGQVKWESLNPQFATVSDAAGSKGLARAVLPGQTEILATLTAASAKGRAPITVTLPALTALQVTPAAPSVDLNAYRTFTATGVLADSTTLDLTEYVNWSSSDPAKAPVSNAPGSKGTVKGTAAGTTTITATEPGSGKTDNTSLTVTGTTVAANTVTFNGGGFTNQVFTHNGDDQQITWQGGPLADPPGNSAGGRIKLAATVPSAITFEFNPQLFVEQGSSTWIANLVIGGVGQARENQTATLSSTAKKVGDRDIGTFSFSVCDPGAVSCISPPTNFTAANGSFNVSFPPNLGSALNPRPLALNASESVEVQADMGGRTYYQVTGVTAADPISLSLTPGTRNDPHNGAVADDVDLLLFDNDATFATETAKTCQPGSLGVAGNGVRERCVILSPASTSFYVGVAYKGKGGEAGFTLKVSDTTDPLVSIATAAGVPACLGDGGTVLNVAVTITAAAEPVKVAFWVNRPTAPTAADTPDLVVTTQGGGTFSPPKPAGLTSGRVWAWVDWEDAILETNETNNVTSLDWPFCS